MKETELRKHADCDVCGKPIGASHLLIFWIVKVERHGVKLDAIRRQDGLAAFLGSPKLAQVMGADEDMSTPLMDPVELTVCESCGTMRQVVVAELAEKGTAKAEQEARDAAEVR